MATLRSSQLLNLCIKFITFALSFNHFRFLMKNRPTSSKSNIRHSSHNIPSTLRIIPKRGKTNKHCLTIKIERDFARLLKLDEEQKAENVVECEDGGNLSFFFIENSQPTIKLLHRQVERLKNKVDKLEEHNKISNISI